MNFGEGNSHLKTVFKLKQAMEVCSFAAHINRAEATQNSKLILNHFCNVNVEIDSSSEVSTLSRIFPSAKFSEVTQEVVPWQNEPDEVHYFVDVEFEN